MAIFDSLITKQINLALDNPKKDMLLIFSFWTRVELKAKDIENMLGTH
jgi:hypothetical protein